MSTATLPLAENTARTRPAPSVDWLTDGAIYGSGIALGLLGLATWINHTDSSRTELGQLLSFLAAVLVVAPTLARALYSSMKDNPDRFSENLLAIAMLGALAAGEYATAILVPLIMGVGHLVERHSIQGTQAAINSLTKLQARQATIETPDGEETVAAEILRAGQVLIVRPGEVLPADGVILSGTTHLDESSITGESVPREASERDLVYAGSINLAGRLRVEVTQVGTATSLGKIARLLEFAAQSKLPVQKTLERYAEFYVPAVALLAAFIFLVTDDMQRLVSVFIVACPCAMVLAGPAATVATIATSSRGGILVKNAKFLDALAAADTVVFDKTGTLTLGQLELISALPSPGVSNDELFRAAAVCAQGSQHPIARAIRFCVADRRCGVPDHGEDHCELPGRGVEAVGLDGRLRMGQFAWLQSSGIDCPAPPPHTGPLAGVARDDMFLGYLLFADPLRSDALELVERLRNLGIQRIVLLTGDRPEAARPIAEAIRCDVLHAGVLPEQKLTAVQAECAQARKVLVVGDGINDALALAAGHVSIAIGARASEIAIQSADIALMGGDLRRIADAILLARMSRRVILQNMAIALGSTCTMLAISATGLLSPLLGALLHNVGTIGVLLNSARLLGCATTATNTPGKDSDGNLSVAATCFDVLL
ncbi:MAG TPA: cation-translocating P-type ATPase [Pirellulales bacterium]|nr:cation-translocating P-type ATPase [Pirellulales bacterium]